MKNSYAFEALGDWLAWSHQYTPKCILNQTKATNNTINVVTASYTQGNTSNKLQQHKNAKKNKNQQQQLIKNAKISPFYIINPFYLDELQREKDERVKHQKEIKQRMERERKKRQQLQSKLAESSKFNKDKFSQKQWVPMGGLGPNIGSEQWMKKSQLHNKMLKFAQDIKKMNFQKIKCTPFVSLSHLHNNSRVDPRSKGIDYSRSVPKPRIMAGEQTLSMLPRSESKEQLTELQKLNLNHIKYMQMMKKI